MSVFRKWIITLSGVFLMLLSGMSPANESPKETHTGGPLILLGPVELKYGPSNIVLKSLNLEQILVLGPSVVEEWDSSTDSDSDPWFLREYLVWNWRKGTLEPLIRLPEKNPHRQYLSGGSSPEGRRYLLVRENDETLIYVGDRYGNLKNKIPLRVDFKRIFASAMADNGYFYFLAPLPSKKPNSNQQPVLSGNRTESNSPNRLSWLHIVDKNGKLQWSGLKSFALRGKGTIISYYSAEDYRITLRHDRVYVVAGSHIRVLDRTPKVIKTVDLKTPDSSADLLNVFQVSNKGEFLVQWALGMDSENPFFDLVRYDPEGNIIENDLLRPLRKELDVDWLWVEVADGDNFLLCGSTRASRGHRCYLGMWNTSDGTTWSWTPD